MTLHKLSAGDGYTYLTKQVAVGDRDLTKGQELADYYAKGEKPGVWAGSGITALRVSGTVREDQMQALFGEGLHPDADILGPIQLGQRYKNFTNDSEFKLANRAAVEAFRIQHGRGATDDERAVLRFTVARNLIAKDNPSAARHPSVVQAYLADERRSERHAVAGYDLVFSPVKSISTLWAVAPLEVSNLIEAAHEDAWRSTLAWLEKETAFTRTGKDGVAQVETRGLVVTAFDHRTSRTGDPDLHTHMVVSNKVQGLDGKWRALDARVLHAAAVAASEMYNSKVEGYVRDRLGVAFHDVERPDGKRSVREIVGVPTELMRAFSQRRTAIDSRLVELIRDYRTEYGKDPSRAVQVQLAQQANLDTRDVKGDHRSLAELRIQWRETARETIGKFVPEQMVAATRATVQQGESRTLEQVAADVLDVVSRDRSTWNGWHIRAEADRQLRALPAAQRDAAVDAVQGLALSPNASIRLTIDGVEAVPAELQRSTGESMFRVHGAARYTARAVLDAEDRLVAAGRSQCPWTAAVDADLLAGLNDGQRDLVRHFATNSTRLAVGVGPAGAGKTTAMRALVQVWETIGRRVIGLAPSASAAQTLSEEIGVRADTIARLLTLHRHGLLGADALAAGDLLLVDEAGTAGTRDLDDLRALAAERDAVVRLVGDPEQLSAVAAGGMLRLLVSEVGAAELTEVHRFRSPEEASASLALRVGNTDALDFYTGAHRVHGGTEVDAADQAYAAWRADTEQGEESVMIAVRTATVAELNERAQADLIAAGTVTDVQIALRDDQRAGIGDRILTRKNDSRIPVGVRGDRVRNGYLWTILERNNDGSLQVQRVQGQAVTTLPAEYVATSVDLGYASTVNRAQGITVDRSRVMVEQGMTRQQLYVAMTRGRETNDAYVPIESHLDADVERAPEARTDAEAVLRSVLARDGAELSATEVMRAELHEADRQDTLVRQHTRPYADMPDRKLAETIATWQAQQAAAQQWQEQERNRDTSQPGPFTRAAEREVAQEAQRATQARADAEAVAASRAAEAALRAKESELAATSGLFAGGKRKAIGEEIVALRSACAQAAANVPAAPVRFRGDPSEQAVAARAEEVLAAARRRDEQVIEQAGWHGKAAVQGAEQTADELRAAIAEREYRVAEGITVAEPVHQVSAGHDYAAAYVHAMPTAAVEPEGMER